MATSQRARVGAKSTARNAAKGGALEGAAANASNAVRQAAAVLEKELAAGLTGVQRLEQRFEKDHRIDQAAFDEVLQSLRTNAHEFVDVASNRMSELRAGDVQELAQQFTTHAQDLLDSVISLLAIGPDIVNRLVSRAEEALGDAPTESKTEAKRATKATATKRPATKRAATKRAATKTAATKRAATKRSRS